MRKIPGAPELAGTGSLYPSILDHLAIYRARFAGHSVIDMLRPFLDSGDYNWRSFVIPGTSYVNPVDGTMGTIPPNGTANDQISIAPNSFLAAISGYSDQPGSFNWLLTDVGTGQQLSSDYCLNNVESGGVSAQFAPGGRFAGRGPLPFILPAPWMVSDAGLLLVNVTNLDPGPNDANINIVFYFAEYRGKSAILTQTLGPSKTAASLATATSGKAQ